MMRKSKHSIQGRRLWPLLAGMLITTALSGPPAGKEKVYAWWGTMYPQYCFSEKAEEMEESMPVKIDFRWLHIK